MDTSDKILERSLGGGGDLLTHVINRYKDLVISPEISQLVSYNKRYKVVNVLMSTLPCRLLLTHMTG